MRVALSALELTDVVDICIDNIFAHTREEVGFEVGLETSDNQAVLVVRDHGDGFAAGLTQPRQGTSGLGLKIARRTVEHAHGVLTTSAPGEAGAQVRVELPVVRPAEH